MSFKIYFIHLVFKPAWWGGVIEILTVRKLMFGDANELTQSKSNIAKENIDIIKSSGYQAPGEFACGRESHSISNPPFLQIARVSSGCQVTEPWQQWRRILMFQDFNRFDAVSMRNWRCRFNVVQEQPYLVDLRYLQCIHVQGSFLPPPLLPEIKNDW